MKNIKTLGALASLAFSLVFPLLFSNPAVTTIAVFALIFAVAAMGWNILSGFTGYVSLGHAAFYGLGAYLLLLVCHTYNIPGGFSPLLLLPVVGLLTGICAFPLGWIALRTRHYTFMVMTIAIFVMMAQLPNLLSGIFAGLSEETLPIPTWDWQIFNLPFYYTALVLLLLALAVSWYIRHTKYGLSLLALRDDEVRAQGLGVQVGAYKLIAFIISASFVGMAGAINAYFLGFISPASAFDRSLNIAIPLMAFLGGTGTLWGPMIGALLVVSLQQYLTLQYGAQGWDLILYGLLLLGVILVLPEGIIPTLSRRWASRRNSYHGTIAVESTPFAVQEVATSISSGSTASPDTRATPAHDVPHAQQPAWIATRFIPSHHHAESPDHRGLTHKIRAQRLTPLAIMSSTTSPGQPSAPPISLPCPRCAEPLWLWDEKYFCVQCGLTLTTRRKVADPR